MKMLSTRPPPPLSSSMEVIPKRYRSGSISSRLRSASELFDDGIIVDRQQKGVLKDLIISEDEALADALARYERGDKEPIKNLLREGVLNRKSSLDLLGEAGDLNFDFLSVSANTSALAVKNNLDAPFPMDDDEMSFEALIVEGSDVFGKSPTKKFGSVFGGRAQMGLRSASLSSVPANGVKPSSSKANASQHSMGTNFSFGTPPDLFEISLLDETGVGAWAHPAFRVGGGGGAGSFSSMRGIKEVLEFDSDDLESPPTSLLKDSPEVMSAGKANGGSGVPPLPKPKRQTQPKTPKQNDNGSTSATSAPIVIPKPAKTNSVPRVAPGTTTSTEKKKTEKTTTTAQAAPPTPQTAEERAASRRAQGVPMIGAYSPESRKTRVDRFVAKRDRRVWKKKVKYDVRKNFADSRLRVKGRFVKKEDEEMLRDLMTMV